MPGLCLGVWCVLDQLLNALLQQGTFTHAARPRDGHHLRQLLDVGIQVVKHISPEFRQPGKGLRRIAPPEVVGVQNIKLGKKAGCNVSHFINYAYLML